MSRKNFFSFLALGLSILACVVGIGLLGMENELIVTQLLAPVVLSLSSVTSAILANAHREEK
jgi:hypothetical protein